MLRHQPLPDAGPWVALVPFSRSVPCLWIHKEAEGQCGGLSPEVWAQCTASMQEEAMMHPVVAEAGMVLQPRLCPMKRRKSVWGGGCGAVVCGAVGVGQGAVDGRLHSHPPTSGRWVEMGATHLTGLSGQWVQ